MKKRHTPKITSSLITGMMKKSFINYTPLSSFFDFDGAHFILRNFRHWINRGMGQEVDRSLVKMERHKNHPPLRAQAELSFYPDTATFGCNCNIVPFRNSKSLRIDGIYLGQKLRIEAIQGGAAPCHGPRMIMLQDPPGAQDEWILAVGRFNRGFKRDCKELPFSPAEFAPVKNGGPGMIRIRTRPDKSCLFESRVRYPPVTRRRRVDLLHNLLGLGRHCVAHSF